MQIKKEIVIGVSIFVTSVIVGVIIMYMMGKGDLKEDSDIDLEKNDVYEELIEIEEEEKD